MLTHYVDCALVSESILRQDSELEPLAEALRGFLANGDRRAVFVEVPEGRRYQTLEARLGRERLEHVIARARVDNRPDSSVTVTSRSAIEARLSVLGMSPHSTISIGADREDLGLRQYARLHFHVGPRTCLDTKIRGVVPIIEQYEVGAANTLRHLSQSLREAAALQSSDLVDFVDRAANHFRYGVNGAALLSKHVRACRFLAEKFPDEIAGLFGSGFPFYTFDGNFDQAEIAAPASVVSYCDEQHAYFSQKCLSEASYLRDSTEQFTHTQLEESLGIRAGCNEFDAYEYERVGHLRPAHPAGPSTLREYYEANCFDIDSDLWPCQFCAPIQLAELYPAQRRIMDTNIDCLPCNQTSIKLRNVMGAARDIDILVMARGNAEEVAKTIKQVVIEDGTYHLYDLGILQTVLQDDGPIDIFVFDLEEVLIALDRLASPNWRGTSAETIALWCPTARFQARLDLCFALAFEPVIVMDETLRARLADTRRRLGGGADVEAILTALREDSFWTQQLMENAEVVDALKARILGWKFTQGEQRIVPSITE